MIGYCDKCDKKNTCTKLCKEAEEYTNQDYIGLKEGTNFGNVEEFDSEKYKFQYVSGRISNDLLNLLTEKQKEVVIMYFEEGKSQYKIGKLLNIDHKTVCEHINMSIAKIGKIIKNFS